MFVNQIYNPTNLEHEQNSEANKNGLHTNFGEK